MTEFLKQPSTTNVDTQRTNGYSQYQPQTLTFYNTPGLIIISVLAFALLIGLLREHARYHELAKKLAQNK